jgi:predicted tellurium resistance membrane protein TerC
MQILIYISIVFATILLIWISEAILKRKWLKYIVVIILFIISLIYLNNAYNIPSPDFEDLGEFVIGVYCLIVAVIATITSFIIDFIRKQKVTKKKQ